MCNRAKQGLVTDSKRLKSRLGNCIKEKMTTEHPNELLYKPTSKQFPIIANKHRTT